MKVNGLNDALAAHKKMNDYFNNKGTKTIEDAVKEFNGVWPIETNGNHWWLDDDELKYSLAMTVSLVCTRQEFEDYAKMMELNKLNKEAVKEQRYTIKDAYNYYKYNVSKREDATYIVCNKKDGSFEYFSHDICSHGDFYIIGSIDEFKSYERSILPDDNKPVFTQEMADNGELPPVGFGCMIEFNENKWQEFKLITETELSLFCCVDNKEMVIPKDARLSFKLFETRTDKEKLIDAVALKYADWFNGATNQSVAEFMVDHFNITSK